MNKNYVTLKVAIGYGIVAIALVLSIALIYGNTQSLVAINKASKEYNLKRERADSLMKQLLDEEQDNLQELADAMKNHRRPNLLLQKVKSLSSGKDSVVIDAKDKQTHEAKQTTVEVVKTKKGFFRRLADAFKKSHTDTVTIRQDSNRTVVDTLSAPVNVGHKVANMLAQIDQEEKNAAKGNQQAVYKEMRDLQMVSTQLALRSAQQINSIRQKEKLSMEQALDKAMRARQTLLWQISLLAIVAIATAIILLWYVWRTNTKERIYRENLEQANEEIQRIMQQRERLLLTITHDIKAPAASIAGFIDLMKDTISDEQALSYLQSIKNSATHLSQLVAALLDYHQLENGLMKVQPVGFSPVMLIQQSVDTLRIQAQKKGLRLEADTHTCPPHDMYRADAFRIRQILDNLIGNAIKYTEQGEVTVIATINTSHLLTVKVKDTGKGMTHEEARKVFQAFTRLQNAQGIEGTGLGLSITHELVTLLGGTIHLQSVKGKGSTFTVSIPLEHIEPTGKDNLTGDDNTNGHKTWANHKILILDDDSLQLQLLREMLHRLVGSNWKIMACNHITEALTALHNEQPALMMMDIEMPEMNGMELIKHINHAHISIIAMTAHDASIKPQLAQAGFDDCLFKPFKIEALRQILGIKEDANKKETTNEKEDANKEKTTNEKEDANKEKTEEAPKNSLYTSRFAPLLAFAENDAEAEQEILHTLEQELTGYLQGLQEDATKPTIGKIAHKLLPIASMLQMGCIEQITSLAPEHIEDVEQAQMHEHIQEISQELQSITQELRDYFFKNPLATNQA